MWRVKGKKFWLAFSLWLTFLQPAVLALAAEHGAEDTQVALQQRWRGEIEAAMKLWQTPGLAVVIVKDGEVVLAEGFGWRDLEGQLPVDAQTLFAIGSSTKALTATALGRLVDQGKLAWEQPVQSYLPEFQLQDPALSRQLTLVDLLSHRSGLPRHDFVWYGQETSRQELFQNLKHLQLTADLRSRFQYQNLMYMSAGVLLEKLSGQSWEDYLIEQVLQPLEMRRSTPYLSVMQADANHALPYRLKQGKLQRLAFRSAESVGPAGSLHSSAQDMAQWLQFNLGNLQGDASLLKPGTLKQLHSPQVILSQQSALPEIPFKLYGLGWLIYPYRGQLLLEHGGNIDGFSASVSFLPHHNSGVVVLSNKDGDALTSALMYRLSDDLLGLEPLDWHTRLQSQSALMAAFSQDLPQLRQTRPSHELADYVASYRHPAYGQIQIQRQGQQLRLQYGQLTALLKHWHYDSFQLQAPDSPLEGLLLSFDTDPLGVLHQLRLKLEPLAEPVVFQRQVPAAWRQPAYLQAFVGEYALESLKLQLKLDNGRLWLWFPGQEVSELEPHAQDLFKLAAQEGFWLHFARQGQQIKALTLVQPNGTLQFKPRQVK